MRILVTGGTGFVGQHLVSQLRASGRHTVLSTTTSSGGTDPKCKLLNLPDESACFELLEKFSPNAVIHLAALALVPKAERDPGAALRVNVEGTWSLLKALERSDPRGATRLIYVSSAHVYDARGGGRMEETQALYPTSVYGRSKLSAELLADLHTRETGRELVVFRPFNHAGPGQDAAYVVSSFARQVARIELGRQDSVLEVGSLDLERDFCDVRDVCRAYESAAEGSVPTGTYNLASGHALPLNELVERLRHLITSDFEVRCSEDRQRSDEIPSLCGAPGKINRACGWKPTIGIEQTLSDTLEWWRERERG